MSEDNNSLPPELNWEQMEAGILAKMNKTEAPDAKLKSSRSVYLIGLMVLCLFMAATIFYLLTEQAITLTDEQVLNTATFREEVKEQTTSAATSTAAIVETAQASSAILNENTPWIATTEIETSHKETSTPAVDHLLTEENLTATTPTNNSIITSNSNSGIETTDFVETVVNTSMQSPSIAIDVPAVASDVQEITSDLYTHEIADGNQTNYTIVVQALEKEIAVLSSPVREISSRIEYNPTSTSLCPSFTSKNKGQITVLGGTSYWKMGFGNTLPERQDYEQTIRSYFSQLSYQYPLQRNYNLMLGFQYQQLNHRFDWSTPVEDYTLILQDTILRIEINTVTGEENIIRGDVELQVPAERNVRHFNKTELYQAQFALGKKWAFQRWQVDALMGGVLSVAATNQGRTLYEAEVLDYSGSENSLFNNQWKAHAMVAGRLSYRISDRWGISTNLQLQHSVMDWSPRQQTTMRPTILNVGLGVNYSL